MNTLDITALRAALRYSPESGAVKDAKTGESLFRKPRPDGYFQRKIMGKAIYAHRLAWALHYGSWPEGDIDHINGDKSDNRITNLRVVSRAENQKNRPITAQNTSGVCGVSWDASRSKWRADIRSGGKKIALGRFNCKSAALIVRKAAEAKAGYHPNHGRASE